MTVSALAVTKMGSLLVIEVATTPPPLSTDVGVDLGLTSLAALSTWGCHRETRGTPLQGARSGPSATRSGPERKGSNNREKAATRSQSYTAGFGELDWTAPQIVSATDPRSPSGVCRTPRGIRAGPHRDLAQSVHDAGWVTLVGVGGRAERVRPAGGEGRLLVSVVSALLTLRAGSGQKPLRVWNGPALGAGSRSTNARPRHQRSRRSVNFRIIWHVLFTLNSTKSEQLYGL